MPPAASAPAGIHRRLPRPAAFWTVTLSTVVLVAASSAPSPLYAVYQRMFGFSALTLTAIFAVYVLALLLSLLTVGRLSDVVGRRPVLAAAIAVETASMGIFLGADSVTWLVAARVVQGFATGAALGVLGAYLLDLQPPGGGRLGSLVNSVAPSSGLGLGAIGTGVLVQYAPHPTKLVFVVLLILFVLVVLSTGVLPETVRSTPGTLAALRPSVSVPPAARRAFLGAVPAMLSTWALIGLIFSLGGSLLDSVFDQNDEAVIGLLLGAFALAGSLAACVVDRLPARTMSTVGTATLVVGVALFLLAVDQESLAVFVAMVIVAGAGFGAAFLGVLRSITQLAEPHERAALLSAVYIVSYLAFSVPAVVGGLLIVHIGLRDTATAYGVLVAVLAVASLGIAITAQRRPARLVLRHG